MADDTNALSAEEVHAKETESFAVLGADGKPVEPEATGRADGNEDKGKKKPDDKKAEPAKAKTDAAKDGDGKGKDAGGDDQPDPDDMPDWLKKRVERANKKEAEAERRATAAEKRADEAFSAVEALRAELEELRASREAPKEPDPDDFDSMAEYERAKRDWQKAQAKPAKKDEATKPDEEEDKGKTEKKKDAQAAPLPVGMSADEYEKIETEVVGALSKTTLAGLKQLKVFPVGILAAVHDVADGEPGTIDEVGKFILENPKIYEGILNTAERNWNKNLDRAFTEWQQRDQLSEKRKDVEQPEVISRSKGAAIPIIGGDDYAEYEKRRNEEERQGR